MPGPPVPVTGELDPADLERVARDGAPVTLDPAALTRMQATSDAVARAAAGGRPIYGMTTGLGSRVTEPVDGTAEAELSRRTIRGRATAVGDPLGRELTRAAMAVRLNGLCTGGAGARPAVAQALADMLNHGVHPAIPASGSVGAADLCLMAHVGLGLIGEGRAELDGEWLDAGAALARAGLEPLDLGPRDGLAICSSSAVSIGAAVLDLLDGRRDLQALQVSAALAMEGFRAGVSPLDARVAAARPAPGQEWAAAGLRALLAGGELTQPGAARRLQDPLSFRCVSPLHGALQAALGWLDDALAPELAAAADNPVVLGGDGEIVPTGNFSSPALALALDAAAIAVAQVAHAAAERVARLTESRLSGLPAGLAPEGSRRSGMAPLGKTAHALVLEIRQRAAPVAIHSMVLADGVEDDTTGAAQAAIRLGESFGRLRRLAALELLVAAQAVDLAGVAGRLGAGTRAAHRAVRELVPTLAEDRPLGGEVERIAAGLIAGGGLLRRTGEAAGPPVGAVAAARP
jgi:histidine ammonia-lyase